MPEKLHTLLDNLKAALAEYKSAYAAAPERFKALSHASNERGNDLRRVMMEEAEAGGREFSDAEWTGETLAFPEEREIEALRENLRAFEQSVFHAKRNLDRSLNQLRVTGRLPERLDQAYRESGLDAVQHYVELVEAILTSNRPRKKPRKSNEAVGDEKIREEIRKLLKEKLSTREIVERLDRQGVRRPARVEWKGMTWKDAYASPQYKPAVSGWIYRAKFEI